MEVHGRFVSQPGWAGLALDLGDVTGGRAAGDILGTLMDWCPPRGRGQSTVVQYLPDSLRSRHDRGRLSLNAVGGRHAGTGVKQIGGKSLALNCPCGGLAGGQVYGVSHRLKGP